MTRRTGKRAPFARRLVLMVKVPAAGRVKTRLARTIGAVHAAAVYRHTTSAVLARLGGATAWLTILAVAPDTSRRSSAWPARFERLAQGGGDLGRRMQRVMDRLPPGPVVIIGTDVPGIRPGHVRAAFAKLGSHDAVVGPSPDGGYWLVGLRRSPRVARAFGAVRWSAPETLADTLRNLRGLRVAFVAALADLDDEGDLERFAGAHGRRVLPLAFGA
ncbi:MAG TPA: TIGR04282 family arsenosugar biosynthesis glycosyltransferase [Hyphomicrobiaceae bacterium]|nr:TIGR04282 family arsenosugar biosynthesis glycosyltransferase [Hyphomicrobiaceae bacterium]